MFRKTDLICCDRMFRKTELMKCECVFRTDFNLSQNVFRKKDCSNKREWPDSGF
uniref:Uncharacterized protein n=1 Tax=Anguilla anguilla TaxID=7936 RepID=A0A0E9T072_ANGAN